MKYEVYKIQNKLNNKVYIGITNRGYKNRFKHHISEMLHGSTFVLHNAMRKYGVINFTTTLLEEVDDIETLKLREQYWIKALDTTNREFGYNMTLGGDGTFGRLHSEETKEKIANKAKGRKGSRRLEVTILNLITNVETKFDNLVIAAEFMGKYNSFFTYSRKKYGDCFTIDSCLITIAKPEINTQIKEKKQDVQLHMQMMQKLALESRNNNIEQYKQSQKLAKLESGKTKIVQQYSLDGELLAEYFGTREAAKSVNGQRAPIKNCIIGKTKKSYGFVWKYKE